MSAPEARPPLLRRPVVWFVGLAVAMAVFHAPWLDAPLTMLQLNAGNYFGVFCNNWERFGFWELRGLPLMPQLVENVGDGHPYVHHPPGLSWMFYALGGHEWSMRLPTVVSGFVAAVFFYRLARTRLGAGPSFVGACLVACNPSFAEVAQASYEPVVIAAGLVVMAEAVAPTRSRAVSCALQAVAAFVGAWMGWGFAFLGLASVALVWQLRRPARSLAPVVVPGVASLVALVTIDLWTGWALAAPGVVPPPSTDTEILELLQHWTFDERPGIGWMVDHFANVTPTVWSHWLIAALLLGIVPALLRAPRIAIAGLVIGAGPYVMLLKPQDLIWFCYSVPLLAFAAAALVDLPARARWRGVRIAAAVGGGVLIGGVVHASSTLRAESATPLFRDLGEALSEAAAEPRWQAAHNFPYGVAYYFQSPRIVLQGLHTPEQLQALVDAPGTDGWRYIWLEPTNRRLVHPLMKAFLEPFEKRRLPRLEGRTSAKHDAIVIEAAWLVTLREPR